MSWLIFSDMHLDKHKAFSTITNRGLNSRLVQQVDIIRQVKRILRKEKVTTVFFLGDLFNSLTENISKIVYNVAFYLVQNIAELAHVYLVTGNHDLYNNIHTFTPFSSIPGVEIISETTTITVDDKKIDIVPWNCEIPKGKSPYCFGHFGIEGAVVGEGFNIDAEVSKEALKKYELVLSGHYHTRQKVANNAYHIGAVMSTSFKDSIEDKGVWLLEDSKLRFVPIKSRKFCTVEVAYSDQIEQFITTTYNEYDYFRLLVKSDDLIIPEFKDNVIVKYDYDPRTPEEMEIPDTSEITSLIPIISEFIDKSKTALDKTILKAKAIELLGE